MLAVYRGKVSVSVSGEYRVPLAYPPAATRPTDHREPPRGERESSAGAINGVCIRHARRKTVLAAWRKFGVSRVTLIRSTSGRSTLALQYVEKGASEDREDRPHSAREVETSAPVKEIYHIHHGLITDFLYSCY